MSHALTGYYKRIIRRQISGGRFNNESEVVRYSLRLLDAIDRGAGPPGASFCGREELQELLMEGLEQGPATPPTPRRRAAIYEVLKGD